MGTRNTDQRIRLHFTQDENRTLRADVKPTIATPGIRITITPNNCTGEILLYLLEQGCNCSSPSQCSNLKDTEASWSNFPCKKAPLSEVVLTRFMFEGALHPIILIKGMKDLAGIEVGKLPLGQRAAMEILRETDWGIEMPV
jgi:hypothetical protein